MRVAHFTQSTLFVSIAYGRKTPPLKVNFVFQIEVVEL